MKALLPLFALLVSACAVGPYASTPRYLPPKTRGIAARQLNEALAFGSRNISEVAADELRLTWIERRALTDKRYVNLERELVFTAIRSVTPAEQPGEWWELRVDAVGGQITFDFDDGQTASKAESALRRLSDELSDTEERELAYKYLRAVEGKVDHYVERNGERLISKGKRVENPDWMPVELGIELISLLTGRDFGTDAAAWHAYVNEHYRNTGG